MTRLEREVELDFVGAGPDAPTGGGGRGIVGGGGGLGRVKGRRRDDEVEGWG